MATQIKFGTSGWRAIVADEFTVANVKRAVTGIARYVAGTGKTDPKLVVGRDPRFMGETFVDIAATILERYGITALVISEAWMFGKPVICSNVGAMADRVKDGIDGLHFEMGDPGALARTIKRAATEPGLWTRLASGVPKPPSRVDMVEGFLLKPETDCADFQSSLESSAWLEARCVNVLLRDPDLRRLSDNFAVFCGFAGELGLRVVTEWSRRTPLPIV